MGKGEINSSPIGELDKSGTSTYPPSVGNPHHVQIREATTRDIPWILDELREFSKFYGTKLALFPKDDLTAFQVIEGMIKNHVFLLAVGDDGTQMGFISGFVSPNVYNPDIRMLTETFWWVALGYRGTRAGQLLLQTFIEWGKQNVDWISFTLENHSPVSDRVLTNRGFKLQEKTYLLECT